MSLKPRSEGTRSKWKPNPEGEFDSQQSSMYLKIRVIEVYQDQMCGEQGEGREEEGGIN